MLTNRKLLSQYEMLEKLLGIQNIPLAWLSEMTAGTDENKFRISLYDVLY